VSDFGAISGFPTIQLNEILEMEFNLAYNIHCSPCFNNMDFFEFVWHFHRIGKEREKERMNKQQSGNKMSLESIIGAEGS
jgi:hypothetical protein